MSCGKDRKGDPVDDFRLSRWPCQFKRRQVKSARSKGATSGRARSRYCAIHDGPLSRNVPTERPHGTDQCESAGRPSQTPPSRSSSTRPADARRGSAPDRASSVLRRTGVVQQYHRSARAGGSSTTNVPVAVRPRVSGWYIISASTGGCVYVPRVVARATYVYVCSPSRR